METIQFPISRLSNLRQKRSQQQLKPIGSVSEVPEQVDLKLNLPEDQ